MLLLRSPLLPIKVLSDILKNYGRHSMLSVSSSLPVSVKRILDDETNKFYDKGHQLYEAVLLIRCYTQHVLRPFIDSEVNHKRYFIKSRKENPQKLTQLSSRSHPRHLVGEKGQHKKTPS